MRRRHTCSGEVFHAVRGIEVEDARPRIGIQIVTVHLVVAQRTAAVDLQGQERRVIVVDRRYRGSDQNRHAARQSKVTPVHMSRDNEGDARGFIVYGFDETHDHIVSPVRNNQKAVREQR